MSRSLIDSEVKSCCSVRMIPLMLVDEVCKSIHISLVDKNGEQRNINTLGPPSGELLKASDFKAYSVITESDYVWEANNDDGGYTALSPEVDKLTKQKLKLSQHAVTDPAAGELSSFPHDGDLITIDFSIMKMSSYKSGIRQIRQGRPYWCYKYPKTGFIRHENDHSDSIEEMYRYGGRFVAMGGTQYTFMFSPANSYQVDISSGDMVEITRYPPVNSNPREIQVNVSLQGNLLIIKRLELEHNPYLRELAFSFSANDKLKQVVVHQLANVTRSYCVSAEHILLGDNMTSKMYGARWYVDRLYAVLESFTIELCQFTASQAVSSSPLSRDSTSLSPEWDPQINDCELKNVSKDAYEWKYIYSLMRDTLPTVAIMKIQRVQNKPLKEKYELEKRQMEKRNKREINEQYLFHGSKTTSPEEIAFSQKGVDFRYSKQTKNLWGNGAYLAVKATYSDYYSHHIRASSKKQLLLVLVLTGKSFSYGTRQDPTLTKPPPLPKSSSSQGSMLYDTVNGHTNDSQVYVVYDHDKSYPAYIITYTS